MEISFCSNKHKQVIDGEKGGTYSVLKKMITKARANCSVDEILMVFDALKAASCIKDLPKSYRFHALSGNHNGEYAVNINSKYRILFKITDKDISQDKLLFAKRIEITEILIDYH